MDPIHLFSRLNANLLMAAPLCGLGAGLLVWHIYAWRQQRSGETDPAELDFAWRQYRRRMQASSMMVVLGLAILASGLIESRLTAIFYWAGVLLLVLWMGTLALADIFATQHHLGREKQRVLLERKRLEAEFNRPREVPHDGQAAGTRSEKY